VCVPVRVTHSKEKAHFLPGMILHPGALSIQASAQYRENQQFEARGE
jgi:hypothetical protein